MATSKVYTGLARVTREVYEGPNFKPASLFHASPHRKELERSAVAGAMCDYDYRIYFRPPRSGPQLVERPAGGTQLRCKRFGTARRPLQTSNSGLSVDATVVSQPRSAAPKKSLTAPLLHPSTHHATLEALVPVSVLSLAAHYLSRMGSSRPLERFRSTSAQLQAIFARTAATAVPARHASSLRASITARDLC